MNFVEFAIGKKSGLTAAALALSDPEWTTATNVNSTIIADKFHAGLPVTRRLLRQRPQSRRHHRITEEAQ